MSRRTAKKRLKKINQVQEPALQSPVSESAAAAPASAAPTHAAEPKAPAYEMFLQYQNCEFVIEEIGQRILDKCAADGMDSSALKIYIKPEDRKAYYSCTGGNSFIEL